MRIIKRIEYAETCRCGLQIAYNNNEVGMAKSQPNSKADARARKKMLRLAFEKVPKVYQAIGADDKCELFMFEASGHTFSGVRAYPWLKQYLM